MANSMIPYSFTPGTKAKAGEVNANFNALAEIFEKFKNDSISDISDINELLNKKVEPDDLVTNFTVTTSGEDLNNYKTPGTYVFQAQYTPTNNPGGTEGVLTVKGDESSIIKQIWYRADNTNQIYTRYFKSQNWSKWTPVYYNMLKLSTVGYIKFDNGILIQWGHCQGPNVTYPIAFSTIACPVFTKHGYSSTAERSDSGFVDQTRTGFQLAANGTYYHENWIAIGY